VDSSFKSPDKAARIIPYQSSWPAEFSQIGAYLRMGLGSLALRIDHIGSTAVPGLAAKDVIDIQVTVAGLNEAVLGTLTQLGYIWAPEINCDHHPPLTEADDIQWEKWYFRPPAGQRSTHIHVRVGGRLNQRYPLLFRDYLRAHPSTAEAYAELKRRLAEYLPDRVVYTEVKDPAVDLIYLAAEEWAAANHWSPGKSDA
jgi:GrpB-like predicted nucleotidyltransferase (UPF0157 family)